MMMMMWISLATIQSGNTPFLTCDPTFRPAMQVCPKLLAKVQSGQFQLCLGPLLAP